MLVNHTFFNDLLAPFFAETEPYHPEMKSDIIEKEDHYEIFVNLPGYQKDNISAELQDGYLLISAQKDEEKEEKNNEGKVICKERFVGSCSRQFFVGEIDEKEVKAEFTNGVLILEVPKEPKKSQTQKQISIK